jgi:hypothetical protein
LEGRQYFECLLCGQETEITGMEQPKCARCGSGNGIISPTRVGERECRAGLEEGAANERDVE